MKIYISADIEGIWGVVSRSQTMSDGKDYFRARKLMTQEVNWVIEEALKAGATKVVVNDSHGPMDNILIEELNPKAELISGSPKPLSMMEGIDETFDGVLLVGYHPRAGTSPGIFDHTYYGKVISNVWINGKPMGESGINAGVAGYFNVPVIFVSGDDQVTVQVKEEIGEIETVAVKETISRYAARNLSREEVRAKYAESLERAFKNIDKYPSIKYKEIITIDIEFNQAIMADVCMQVPGVLRKDPKTVTVISKDYIEAHKLFRALINLAAAVL
ncbi:MAG: M55 family metallopeptidase [Clostridiaceae bacterium]|nr:M55 family metallopeptidase [Clostridiaceae bacterium]